MKDGNQHTLSNEELFEQEFLPHTDALHSFAYRLTREQNDANDLVQETFMKAYRFAQSFEQGTNAKAWLFRILKNTFINDFRKKSKEPSKVDYNEIESFVNTEDVDTPPSFEVKAEESQYLIGDEVANALNSLATEFRTILILSDLEGFKYDEMAKILDIPIGTVRSRLHRARNLLKDK
ncbi:sigma-70 family RNA polymerase sigma factor, partial [Cyclobacteriaceae bacterium]|nr:sigma-70 family RNA polymerase sigma factor [Cyclobacteriaceae bacterium]